MAVATIAALATAGAAVYAANKQSETASDARGDAKSSRRSSDAILREAASRTLKLPEFNAVDDTGAYSPELLDIYGDLQTAAQRERYGHVLDSLGGVIGKSFANDIGVNRALLDDVFNFSQEANRKNRDLIDESLAESGLGSARASAVEGLTSFLNFELPEAARREIQRTTLETGFATGNVGSANQQRLAGQLTSQQLMGNFFQSLAPLSQMTQENMALYQPSLRTDMLPQAGTSLQMELSNVSQRNQASLMNYQNRLNQNIQRYQNDLSATMANFQRQDDFDMLRANVQADRANASTATANANEAAASQTLTQGFSQAGNIYMQGLALQQQQASGAGGRPAGTPTGGGGMFSFLNR